MLSNADYAVIAFYFVFMLLVGWLFRRFSKDSNEYFRGGSRMPWGMVGASNFITGFSAWTFTGAAGVAYDNGIVVMAIYWSSAVALLICGIWVAPKLRQARVITFMEAVRARLGPANEQFFTWIRLPLGVLVAGVWLYGLGVFCAPVFGISLRVTILLAGSLVALVSTLGGSWAVVAGSFLQALVVLPICILVAVGSLRRFWGFGALGRELPSSHWHLSGPSGLGFGVWWLVAMLLDKVVSANGIFDAAKYLYVRDGSAARKAAFTNAALISIAPIIWFTPPLLARMNGLDLPRLFPGLAHPSEGAYVAMAHLVLPVGLMGILVTAIVSSTLSAMDVGLNQNAGVFVRSFYRPILRPSASEREQVLAGRISSLALGGLIILIAWTYSTWKTVTLFSLMINFQALAQTPLVIPLFWSLWLRRVPDWATWVSILVGLAFNAGYELWTVWAPAAGVGLAFWMQTHSYAVMTLGNVFLGSLFYLILAALWRKRTLRRAADIDRFFATINLPLDSEALGLENRSGLRKTGRLAMLYALFICSLMILPNPWLGRAGFLFCALLLLGAGIALLRFSSVPGQVERS